MKYKLTLLLFALLFVSMVSASMPTLGVFQYNEDIELRQTCAINASFCDNCNISSIDYPNGIPAIQNVQMTKRVGDFNYTLNSSYTGQLGQYRVNGYCRVEPDVMKNWVYYFDVTPNGEEPNQAKTLFYVVSLCILVVFLLLSLTGLFKFEDYKGRFALYWTSHLLVVAITFTAWDMCGEFLTGTPFITGMFKILFYFSIIAIFPMVILSLAWIFYTHTVTEEISRLMQGGMDVETAFKRSKMKW